jgi:uncharacterized protein DUF6152
MVEFRGIGTAADPDGRRTMGNARMTKLGARLGTACALMLVGSSPALAHHSFSAEFDANKPVHLEGIISRVEFINPHAWIHVDVKGQDGKVITWMIEAGSPNVLLRRGVTKTSVTPGTQVVVDGYQAKDGSMRANGRDITLPDGRKLFLGSSGTGAPYDDKK